MEAVPIPGGAGRVRADERMKGERNFWGSCKHSITKVASICSDTQNRRKVQNGGNTVSIEQATNQWYVDYYSKKGKERNSLQNPEVLFQTLAMEAAFVRATYSIRHDFRRAAVLDVGCGGGGKSTCYFAAATGRRISPALISCQTESKRLAPCTRTSGSS